MGRAGVVCSPCRGSGGARPDPTRSATPAMATAAHATRRNPPKSEGLGSPSSDPESDPESSPRGSGIAENAVPTRRGGASGGVWAAQG